VNLECRIGFILIEMKLMSMGPDGFRPVLFISRAWSYKRINEASEAESNGTIRVLRIRKRTPTSACHRRLTPDGTLRTIGISEKVGKRSSCGESVPVRKARLEDNE
jgi:hypothetical protein